MVDTAASALRTRVDGKFFRSGNDKFFVKGIAYGPFAPHEQHDGFPGQEQARKDLEKIRQLGANVLRVYLPPPRWFVDLAVEHGFKLLVDLQWNKDTCFLDSSRTRAQARQIVRDGIQALVGHPAIFAYILANEIPADVVRWSGGDVVADFIDELVDVAKSADPDALITYANYPPTEFLRPCRLDFVAFNIYLHHRRAFENYLARLQLHADPKPLLVTEFGIDSLRQGVDQQAEILSWHIEAGFRAGLAGTVLFTYTDEWYKGGRLVEGWQLGLTTADRSSKPAFAAVQNGFAAAPYFPLPAWPRVSVVIACFNGARTLKPCLDSLDRLNYPNYEVILVDDGSTDTTSQIASLYPKLRYFRQGHHGLSVARNTGITASTGEIVAFIDADCRADEDWLYHLVGRMLEGGFAGVGGPNYLPPEDSAVAAAVMASPGGPAHVMLTDRLAEHIPGCNMAFQKRALEEIGGFDPIFHAAGDDVDICWRLQQSGYEIGFSPAGFVWHYRRSTVRAYLRQQIGYGAAEALLARKHPENFSPLGGSIWHGQIYAGGKLTSLLQRHRIYHGLFGTGLFQPIYAAQPTSPLVFCTLLEYHVFVTLPLLVLSAPFPFLLPVGLSSLLLSAGVCIAAAWQADLPSSKRRFWSRPLVALLFFLQPIVRGWARYGERLMLGVKSPEAQTRYDRLATPSRGDLPDRLFYWSRTPLERVQFVRHTLARLDEVAWPSKADSGWCDYDVEIYSPPWVRLQLVTVSELLPGGQRLFRCRLHPGWSLPAMVAFWGALGLELLIIGVLRTIFPWIWMILLSMPLLGWYLEYEKRSLQRAIEAFLDETAAQLNLTKLSYNEAENKFAPAQA